VKGNLAQPKGNWNCKLMTLRKGRFAGKVAAPNKLGLPATNAHETKINVAPVSTKDMMWIVIYLRANLGFLFHLAREFAEFLASNF